MAGCALSACYSRKSITTKCTHSYLLSPAMVKAGFGLKIGLAAAEMAIGEPTCFRSSSCGSMSPRRKRTSSPMRPKIYAPQCGAICGLSQTRHTQHTFLGKPESTFPQSIWAQSSSKNLAIYRGDGRYSFFQLSHMSTASSPCYSLLAVFACHLALHPIMGPFCGDPDRCRKHGILSSGLQSGDCMPIPSPPIYKQHDAVACNVGAFGQPHPSDPTWLTKPESFSSYYCSQEPQS